MASGAAAALTENLGETLIPVINRLQDIFSQARPSQGCWTAAHSAQSHAVRSRRALLRAAGPQRTVRSRMQCAELLPSKASTGRFSILRCCPLAVVLARESCAVCSVLVLRAAKPARRPLAAGIAHCCANLTCMRLRCPLLCVEGSWSGLCRHTCEQELWGVCHPGTLLHAWSGVGSVRESCTQTSRCELCLCSRSLSDSPPGLMSVGRALDVLAYIVL
jgi:hypothetical protein